MTRTVKIMVILGLLVLCGTVWGVDGNDPISHWAFDEGSGTTACDSFGDNDGIIYGATWTTGQIGGALSFDGDDYVSVPDSASLDITGDEITVVAWFKPGATGNNNRPIVSKWLGSNSAYVLLYKTGSVDLIGFAVSTGGTAVGANPTPVNDMDKWYHLAGVYDGSYITVYVDGVAGEPVANTGNINNSSKSLRISGYGEGAANPHHIIGLVDDVRLYNRALSAGEIEELHEDGLDKYELAVTNIQRAIAEKAGSLDRIDAALENEWAAYSALEELLESGDYGDLKKGDIIKTEQKIHSAIQHEEQSKDKLEKSIEKLEDALATLGWEPPVPVSHWKFDEGQGDIAYDSVGDNHGTLIGDLTWTSGIIGGALSFDGVDDYIEIADDDSLTPEDQITVSFWTYRTVGGGATINKYAKCPNESASPGNSRAYTIIISGETNKVSVYICSSVNNVDSLKSNNIIPLNEWHYITVTFNHGDAAIYIDGQLDISETMSVTSIMNDHHPLTIGAFWSYCGVDHLSTLMHGQIDEVSIYNRALSAEEVRLLYYNRLD